MGFNTVNAGTIAAIITLDNTRFTSGLTSAMTSISNFSDASVSAGARISSLGRGLEDLGMAAVKYASVPLAGAMIASMGAAIKFETAITGVAKTANLTDRELETLSEGIMDMSKKIPETTTELAAIAEVAGQLGIKKRSIEDFTEVMAMMATSTNMTAEEAATQLARFANITQMAQSDFDRLGSVVVQLGNNFATTEAEIAEAGQRIAGAGKLVRMSEADIMAIAAAYTSLGINVEAGGTAISRVLRDIETQVQTGGTELSKFAEVANMSVQDFSAAWKEDAATAFDSVIVGLNNIYSSGGNVIQTLKDMGFTEIRVTDAMSRLATSGTVLTSALQHANNAWEDNTALQKEADRRYATTESQIKLLGNQVNVLGIQFGQIMLPTVHNIIDGLRDLLNWVEDLDDETKKSIVTFAKWAVAMGPVTTIIGKTVSAYGRFKTAQDLAIAGTSIFKTNTGLLGKTVLSIQKAIDTYKVKMALLAMEEVAASTATATGTTAKVADTTATVANTAAKNAGTVATKLATAAQVAFNAVAAANPLVWVGVAVAAIVGLAAWLNTAKDGAENLTAASKKQQDEVAKLEKEYEAAKAEFGETSDEVQRLSYQLDEARAAFDENKMTVEEWNDRIQESRDRSEEFRKSQTDMVNEANVEIGAIKSLVDEFDELSRIEARTEEEQVRLLDVTTRLNSSVDGCSITYNTLTDELGGTTEAVRELAEAEQERIQGELALNRMTEIYTEQKNVANDLSIAEEQLAAAKERLAAAEEDQLDMIIRSGSEYMIYSPAVTEAKNAVAAASDEVERLNAEQEANKKKLEELLPQYEAYVTKQSALETAVRLMAEAGMSEEAAIKRANEALGSNIEASDLAAYSAEKHAEAVAAATEEIVEMVAEMPGLQTAITNMGWTIDDFAQKLVDAGVSAEQFEAIVSNQLEEVGNALEEFNGKDHVTLEQFKTNLADRAAAQQTWSDSYKAIMEKTGLDGNSAFIQYIGSLPLEQAGLLEEMANDPNLAALAEEYDSTMATAYENSLGWLDQLAVEGKEKTAEIGKGLADGTKEGYEEVANTIVENAKTNMTSTIEGMREAAGVHSPSTKTIPIGVGMGEGVVVGLKQTTGLMASTVATAMSMAVNQAAGQVGRWQMIGRQMMSNLISAVASQRGRLMSTLNSMFAAAVLQSNNTLVNGYRQAGTMSMTVFNNAFTSGLNRWRTSTATALRATILSINTIVSTGMKAAGLRGAAGFLEGFSKSFAAVQTSMAAAVSAAALAASLKGYIAMHSAGAFCGAGFNAGLKSKKQAIVDTATDIAEAAAKAMNAALAINSPSKVTMKTGEGVDEGLILGMRNKLRAVKATAASIADAASANIAPSMSYAYEPNVNPYTPTYADKSAIDYDQLGAAVVNAVKATGGNDSEALAAKIDEFGSGIISAIANMQVTMDGKSVGNIVTSTVDKNLGKIEARKRRGL